MRDFWKARGGVTQKDLDDAEEKGQARAMIYNNRVRQRVIFPKSLPVAAG